MKGRIMNPKISIIVPIYNVEKYLDRCINSILNQTFSDFELILVNDGSLDRSKEICDFYQNIDNRIILIDKKNEGVSSARNKGLDVAKGEYVYFLDPDDYIDSDAIEYLYNLNTYYSADISCYKMKTYKNEILQSKLNLNEEINIYNKDEMIKEYCISGKFLYSVCNKLFKSKLFIDIRFDQEIKYGEDALINYYLFIKAEKLVISNLQKYNYCINKNSTVSNITEKRLDILKSQRKMYNFLNINYPQYTHYVINQYINSSLQIAIDIGIENIIKEKKDMLKELKAINKEDKDILKNFKYKNIKQKILFNILNISPNIVCKMYKFRKIFNGINRG